MSFCRGKSVPVEQSLPVPPPTTTDLSVSMDLHVLTLTFHRNGVIICVALCAGFLLPDIILSWVICVVACVRAPFSFMTEGCSIIWKNHIFTIHFIHWQTSVLSSLLSCKEHLSNVLCRPVVSFLLGMYLDTYIFSNGPAGSYDDALINFLRNCWTVSQSGYTIYIPTSSVVSVSTHSVLVTVSFWL